MQRAHAQIQLAQRIDEERRAAAHLLAQQRHAGARMVERFDHHVFEFLAQELLDRGLVLFLDFRVVGEQARRRGSRRAVRRHSR